MSEYRPLGTGTAVTGGNSAKSIQEQPAVRRSVYSYNQAPTEKEGTVPTIFVESVDVGKTTEEAFFELSLQLYRSAGEKAQKILKREPDNSQAYLILLMAELQVPAIDQLRLQADPFDDNPLYQKILTLDDAEVRDLVISSNAYITEHLDASYEKEIDRIKYQISYAKTVPELKQVEELLKNMPVFSTSTALRRSYDETLLRLQEPTYRQAEQYASQGRYDEAIRLYESIPAYGESRLLILRCKEDKAREENYNAAVAYQTGGQFREAAEMFAGLQDYKDSAARLTRCRRMIRGDKVRAVGGSHTGAIFVNLFMTAFMCLASSISMPGTLLNLLWGIPLAVAAAVVSIVKARYRPAKRMWTVCGSVFLLFVILLAVKATSLGGFSSLFSGLLYLAMAAGLIFI